MTAHPLQGMLRSVDPVLRTGRVRKILPTYIEADGPNVQLGALCSVEARSSAGSCTFQSEVVRVNQDGIILSPLEDGVPTFSGAVVTACADANSVPVGQAFLGRAVDSLGRPLDAKEPPRADHHHPLRGAATTPLERTSPMEILETGIRAVDGLLTLGKGQRIGVFAASGVGKTSLMSQIAKSRRMSRSFVSSANVAARWRRFGIGDSMRLRAQGQPWSPRRRINRRQCASAPPITRWRWPNIGAARVSMCSSCSIPSPGLPWQCARSGWRRASRRRCARSFSSDE